MRGNRRSEIFLSRASSATCLGALLALALPLAAHAQSFYFGNDLSYVNQMEDCGAVYREHGEPKDPYQIFADRGANLVRVRLWVDPSWWQEPLQQPEGVKPYYSDFVDVRETIARAKATGMAAMLVFHYSDFWADPGRQLIPRRWLAVANDVDALEDSLYNYTRDVLSALDAEGLMPEFVAVGNEITSGLVRHIPEEGGFEPASSVSNSWTRHARLLNAGIRAVREVGATAEIDPKIVIHFASNLQGHAWNFNNVIQNGVTDFDVMGISYYYAWHGGSIRQLESTIRNLRNTFPDYEAMVVETAYLWTRQNFDRLGNIVTEPSPDYMPVIPEKQLEYLTDYTRAVMRGGGSGVVFWEPAWVSTDCRTPWGQGSSHDHLVFFDPEQTNFMENGGGRWMERRFYEDLDAPKVTFQVDLSAVEEADSAYLALTTDGQSVQVVPMADEGAARFSYFDYLSEGTTGTFRFRTGRSPDTGETVPATCATDEGERSFTVGSEDTVVALQWSSCDAIGVSREADDATPTGFLLHPAYPNPFNPATTIAYELPHPAHVRLTIVDVLGREVRALVDQKQAEGGHRVLFDAGSLATGVYFSRLETAGFTAIEPLTLIR